MPGFSDALPASAEASLADVAALTPLQRMLLATDGTVTTVLEAYAGEPVEAVKLLQAFDRSSEGDVDLVPPGVEVLRRRVLLRGRRSGTSLLYAEAVVAVDRVERELVEGLLDTDRPLGALLAERRTETFREILRVGRAPAGRSAAAFGVDPAAEAIFRTYRILSGGEPVVLVTERFPATSFRQPA